MANAPAFQFYPEAYLAGTILFTHEQKGIYMDMLCYQWSHGRLPKEVKLIARLVRSKEPKILPLMSKFVADGEGFFNERLEKERIKQQQYRDRQAELANRRWNANPDAKASANAPVLAMPAGKSIEYRDSSSDQGSLRGFEEFWAAYPKKKAKGAAKKAWLRLKAPMTLLPELLSAIERQKRGKDWQKEAGQFIPHPATWLNAEGWLDEGTFVQPASAQRKPQAPPAWMPQFEETKRLLAADPSANLTRLRELAEALPASAWSLLDMSERNTLKRARKGVVE